jgi:hypothetical protein
MRIALLILVMLSSIGSIFAQADSVPSKLSFNADFRFRLEEDWHSRKPDGTIRDNRSRLRYRLRAGFDYQLNSWAAFGARIRTGNPNKQQDPQLTLGEGFAEFATLPLGFEKAFFEANKYGVTLWLGQNTFPFEKQNELFWSDNVFPEGVFLKKKVAFKGKVLNELDISVGHFLARASGKSFSQDSYFQGFQVSGTLLDKRLVVFPSFYRFKSLPDIPDGGGTYLIDYSIAHLGARGIVLKKPWITLEADLYQNLQDYTKNDSIPLNLQDQTAGLTLAAGIGKLKKKKDWHFKATATYLQRYSAVDYFTQNDWARWDYGNSGSPDGRLTNMKGIELVLGYMLADKLSLRTKFYLVEQIVPYGMAKETNSRIRFDLDIKL